MKAFLRSLYWTAISLPVVVVSPRTSIGQEPARPDPPTALETAASFKAVTGRERLIGVVEMRGSAGMPNPRSWTIVMADPRSPTKHAQFNVRGPRVSEPQRVENLYPERVPPNYFDIERVKVDSIGAFHAADKAAGEAKVGFDLIDYKLRGREYGEEPIWVLTLKTEDGTVMGVVAVSPKTGNVLRTVWHRRGPDGDIVFDDSAAPDSIRPPRPKVEPELEPAAEPVEPAPLRPLTPVPPLADPNEPLPPPPPPLPPPGSLPRVPNVTPD